MEDKILWNDKEQQKKTAEINEENEFSMKNQNKRITREIIHFWKRISLESDKLKNGEMWGKI